MTDRSTICFSNSRDAFLCLAKVQTGSIFGCCRCGQHPQITPFVFFAIRQKFIDATLGSAVYFEEPMQKKENFSGFAKNAKV